MFSVSFDVKLRARSPAHSLFVEGRAQRPNGVARGQDAPRQRPPVLRVAEHDDRDPARRHLALQGLEGGVAIGAARVEEDVDCRTALGLARTILDGCELCEVAEHLAGHRWVLDPLRCDA